MTKRDVTLNHDAWAERSIRIFGQAGHRMQILGTWHTFQVRRGFLEGRRALELKRQKGTCNRSWNLVPVLAGIFVS